MQLLASDTRARHLVREEEGAAAGQLGEMQAALPQERDLDDIADLLLVGFYRQIEPKLLKEEQWGPLATVWNFFATRLERQVIRLALGQNLARTLLRPSILRPPGRPFEGHGLGLVLVPRGRPDAAPVAFCELCLLPTDGRKVDDTAEVMAMLSLEDLASGAEPYLLNFCVAPELRRRGHGRALLHLAEDIVQKVWGRRSLYLHAANDDEAASSFYLSAGYAFVSGGEGERGVPAHMCKQLAAQEAASGGS